MRYVSDGVVYIAGSPARDGRFDGNLAVEGAGGRTTDFDCAIVFSTGQFLPWPAGTQVD